MMITLRSLKHYCLLIIQKSAYDLISEARRGYLGILWWVLEPVLYLAVFYLIFVVVFKRGGEDYVSFLLIGLVVWKWFASSVLQSANCISVNIGLIRQIHIPKFVFPAMSVLTATFKFIIVFVLLAIFLSFIGNGPTIAWFALPVIVLVQLLLMLAVGGVLAAIVPFLPDLKIIIENGMLLLFFLSGIFFDIGSASLKMQSLLNTNPMVGIITSYRKVLISGTTPDWQLLSIIVLVSFIGLILSKYLLKKFDLVYAKII